MYQLYIREVPESNLVRYVDIPNNFAVPPDKCRNSRPASIRPSLRQLPFFFLIHSFHGSKALLGLGLIILNVTRPHSDTTHSTGLLRTSNTGRQNFFLLYVKIKGDLYRFDVAESKYGSHNALTPTTVKGERHKAKKIPFFKKKIYFFKFVILS